MLASDTFACPHSGSSLRALRARDSRKLAALRQQLAAQPVPTRPVQLAPPGMAHRAALQPGARSERFGTAIPTSIITQARQLAGPYTYRGSPTHRMQSKTQQNAFRDEHRVWTVRSPLAAASALPRFGTHQVDGPAAIGTEPRVWEESGQILLYRNHGARRHARHMRSPMHRRRRATASP